MPPTNENSAGPVIATVIILGVIILGGLYFWGERSNSNNGADQNSATASAVDQTTAAIESQSSSDNTSSIESDLNNTNVNTLDAGISAS